ncbi:hypothetical protein K435DRAFT_969717 [Dendrothele bispora CBS 962.96]|uniref:F-box domain-containing protein n=1 Tax=Dendrothele bispora (strain CBS 962.96) TaxID=1314807 RepID=A0A4S8LFS9_DENBC|nr:hypothetical protein K435DRAFT_969717 [Dendrothele bispora CBS 962.96]
MPSNLPTELVELVLDHVYWADCGPPTDYETHFDLSQAKHDTLSACSLVSRSWLPRTRIHLFSIIELDSSDGSITVFLGLLQHPLCTITNYVRDLTFRDGRRWADPYYQSDPYHREDWHGSHLLTLTCLLSIENLKFYNVSFQSAALGVDGAHTFFAAFPCLKSLWLGDCTFDTKTHFLKMISSISLLENLSLASVDCTRNTFKLSTKNWRQERRGRAVFPRPPSPDRSDDEDLVPPPPANLKTLCFYSEGPGIQELTAWLSSGSSTPALHTLFCEPILNQTAVPLASYIQTLGDSLRHLLVNVSHEFPNTIPVVDFLNTVDLSIHKNLESIGFYFIQLDSNNIPHPADYTYHLLNQITSPHMKEIWIRVVVKSLEDLNRLDWNELQRILAKPCFRNLERLVISDVHNLPESMVSDIRQLIATKIPMLASRKAIHVYSREGVIAQMIPSRALGLQRLPCSTDLEARWRVLEDIQEARLRYSDADDFSLF